MIIKKEHLLFHPRFYIMKDYQDEIKSTILTLTKEEKMKLVWLYPEIIQLFEILDVVVYQHALLSLGIYRSGGSYFDDVSVTYFPIYPKLLPILHPVNYVKSQRGDIYEKYLQLQFNIETQKCIVRDFEVLVCGDILDDENLLCDDIFRYDVICGNMILLDDTNSDLQTVIRKFPDYLQCIHRPSLPLQFLRWDSGVLPVSLETPEKYHNFPHFDILFRFQ